MKYIVTRDGESILFSNSLTHKEVAVRMTKNKLDEVLAAGFVSIGDTEVRAYGESVTLKTKSRGDADAEWIGRQLKGYI